MKIVIPENPSIGLCVATHSAVSYVHLNLEAAKRHEPDLPILVHDDSSDKQAELKALCADYGAEFTSTPFRLIPTLGDLSAFVAALRWGHEKGIDIVVKCSRRFIVNKPWVDGLRDLMVNTQYCTASGADCHFFFGFRSEWVAMHVPSYVASGAYAEMEAAVLRNQPYDSLPEAWYHHRARDVHQWAHNPVDFISHADNVDDPQCDLLVRSEKGFPRPGNYDGFVWYAGLLGLARSQKINGVLWHDSHTPEDYYKLSTEFGLDYSYHNFVILPGE